MFFIDFDSPLLSELDLTKRFSVSECAIDTLEEVEEAAGLSREKNLHDIMLTLKLGLSMAEVEVRFAGGGITPQDGKNGQFWGAYGTE